MHHDCAVANSTVEILQSVDKQPRSAPTEANQPEPPQTLFPWPKGIRGLHMLSITSIALSGLNAAQASLGVTANNIANQNTPGYHRQQLVQTEHAGGGVSTALTSAGVEGSALETDIVALLQAKNAFLANIAVFKTSAKMAGVLLDEKA